MRRRSIIVFIVSNQQNEAGFQFHSIQFDSIQFYTILKYPLLSSFNLSSPHFSSYSLPSYSPQACTDLKLLEPKNSSPFCSQTLMCKWSSQRAPNCHYMKKKRTEGKYVRVITGKIRNKVVQLASICFSCHILSIVILFIQSQSPVLSCPSSSFSYNPDLL